MKKNMGSGDRIIRSLIALAMISLYFSGIITGIVGIVLVALAGVFLLTSLISFCPLYLPFGLSTLRRKLQARK